MVRMVRPSRISKVLMQAPVSLPVGVAWINGPLAPSSLLGR